MSDRTWPQPLATVSGPFPEARIVGAAEGMGAHGASARALLEAGWVQPDLVTGMTLWLLARQPRRPQPKGQRKPSAIAGGVWVREQYTIHRPLPTGEVFRVEGESTGRYVRKGRRYSTTRSRTFDAAGNPIASNLSTGLLSYKPDPDLPDSIEGLPLEDTPAPEPDRSMAVNNPHLAELRSAEVGERLGGEPLTLTLEMMIARDTRNSDNPIHSDPEAAREAGLARPIAGGSHVQAFALEPIMARFGIESLLHGAHFDMRWKAPTHADAEITPYVTVLGHEPDRVMFDVDVRLAEGPSALVGTIVVPLA